jgi:hypothetical protein
MDAPLLMYRNAAQEMEMKKILTLLIVLLLSGVPFAAENIPVEKQITPVKPQSVKINMENPLFSPTAHVKEGIVFIPKLESIKRIKEWILTVQNDAGKDIVIFMAKREMPSRIIWDGLDAEGKPVSDGLYSYRFFLDEGDQIFNLSGGSTIIIDATAPFATIDMAEDVYFLNPQTQRFDKDIRINVGFGDENEVDFERSFLSIVNFNGKEVKTFDLRDIETTISLTNRVEGEIVWDAIDDAYNIQLPIGDYKAVLSVFDLAGNLSQMTVGFLIAPMPIKPIKNPKTHEVFEIFFESASAQLSAQVRQFLRDLAKTLKQNLKDEIRIEAFTDSDPAEAGVKNLANSRSAAVRNFLVEEGIASSRMRLINHSAKSEDKTAANNRRVAITIISGDAK